MRAPIPHLVKWKLLAVGFRVRTGMLNLWLVGHMWPTELQHLVHMAPHGLGNFGGGGTVANNTANPPPLPNSETLKSQSRAAPAPSLHIGSDWGKATPSPPPMAVLCPPLLPHRWHGWSSAPSWVGAELCPFLPRPWLGWGWAECHPSGLQWKKVDRHWAKANQFKSTSE